MRESTTAENSNTNNKNTNKVSNNNEQKQKKNKEKEKTQKRYLSQCCHLRICLEEPLTERPCGYAFVRFFDERDGMEAAYTIA